MKREKVFIKFLCMIIILFSACELVHAICKRVIMKPKYIIVRKAGDNHGINQYLHRRLERIPVQKITTNVPKRIKGSN